ncbi:5941_t:CDS:2 [Ambispora gerdemannii]|uniref:5941_t:CDS:1 n=1 Tax=Ambispora gerdemannii TaxID=144530 RepID=A0A9N8V5A3_9GLOM|nr:5941_t:CDS:2 [Ambispora gerdemannii]
MRELLYTILELEKWNRMATCDLCSQFENRENKAVCQIRMRSKVTGEMVSNVCVCARCKEKFEEDELPKCERDNEDLEEKELPLLPDEEISQTAFYERQINALQEKESQLTEEVDTHLEALEIAED